jgi:hypothetical protein
MGARRTSWRGVREQRTVSTTSAFTINIRPIGYWVHKTRSPLLCCSLERQFQLSVEVITHMCVCKGKKLEREVPWLASSSWDGLLVFASLSAWPQAEYKNDWGWSQENLVLTQFYSCQLGVTNYLTSLDLSVLVCEMGILISALSTSQGRGQVCVPIIHLYGICRESSDGHPAMYSQAACAGVARYLGRLCRGLRPLG